MSLRVCAVMACLACSTGAYSESTPPRGSVDVRVRVVPYHAEQVYRLVGFVGYAIGLELEAGEIYRGLGTGDSEAITVDVQAQDLFLKPAAVPVATNITVLTDRRRYHFDYRALDRAPDPAVDDVIYSLRFTYPSSPERAASTTGEQAPPRERNYDYWYCGHPAIRPVAASDDGVHTRLRFADRGELPAIYVRNEDDTDSLLNFSIDAATGEVVIHRVAFRFVLRRGGLTGCVVNQGYRGSGERLPTGTVLPGVRRETSWSSP